MTDAPLTLNYLNEEPRVDSRLVAAQLGNQHESILSLLSDYEDEMKGFGLFRFEIAEKEGRGRPPKFALLNEDQVYFLLTLVRNNDLSVALKVKLVQAFGDARNRRVAAPALKTPAEMLLESAQQLVQHEKQLSQHDQRISELEGWKKTAPINAGQVKTIHALGQALGKHMGYPKAWRLFKEHFGLASYRDLPHTRFEEAKHFLEHQIKSYLPPEDDR